MNHNFVTSYIAAKVNCTSDYSIWFAAFDLEENQPSCSAINCPCTGGLCGSGYFVQNLSRYLNSTGANFQGAFILETILNHNTTPHSQYLPSSIQSAFPQLYETISNNSFRGDFLAVIGRPNDVELISSLTSAFEGNGKTTPVKGSFSHHPLSRSLRIRRRRNLIPPRREFKQRSF